MKKVREIFVQYFCSDLPTVEDGGAMIAATEWCHTWVTGPLGRKWIPVGISGGSRVYRNSGGPWAGTVPAENVHSWPLHAVLAINLRALMTVRTNIIIRRGGSASDSGANSTGAGGGIIRYQQQWYGGGSHISEWYCLPVSIALKIVSSASLDVTNPLVNVMVAHHPTKGTSETMIVEWTITSHYADVIKKAACWWRCPWHPRRSCGQYGHPALMAFLIAEAEKWYWNHLPALNLEGTYSRCDHWWRHIDMRSIRQYVGIANVAKKYHKRWLAFAGSW